ncbi:hypothetical protein SH528x_007240 [Novipirellula sp. SH528]|uniref:hypothetical protein n=1 Tax=Novipirellula sp. SH528 TaxID=3454466 RepID=UPI003F9F9B57
MKTQRQIVPGISLDAAGQATIDPSLHDVLFDLALNLESPTDLPVDFEHVVAAIVIATRRNQLKADYVLAADDPDLIEILTPHVKSVFELYGGRLGRDE